jgi:hypothetical protein
LPVRSPVKTKLISEVPEPGDSGTTSTEVHVAPPALRGLTKRVLASTSKPIAVKARPAQGKTTVVV